MNPSAAFSQWIEAPGYGWIQVAVYHHNTTTRYDEQGNNESLFNQGGRSITTSVFFTGVLGLVRGIDLWVQAPIHYLEFNDAVEARKSTGIGDPRFHIRVGPELFLKKPFPVPIAVRGGLKLTGRSFPVDSEIIPLTEGQRDWELIFEIGHSFYPRPLYAMAWVGYRWREANEKVRRDPGDELFFLTSVGGSLNRWNWKITLEGLFGRASVIFSIPIESSKRRILQFLPSIARTLGPGALEVGGRLPFSGRNLPSGPALFLGYFFRFSV